MPRRGPGRRLMIRMMPAAVRRVNASERAKTPMTTAVRGSRAPRMALRVGPMRLMAATRVMLETAVPSRAIPDIGPEKSVGERHPADSAEEHAEDSETDSAEAHHADSQGKGGHLPDTGLAHTDNVGTVGNHRDGSPQNTGGDIAPLKPYVASGQTTCPYQG